MRRETKTKTNETKPTLQEAFQQQRGTIHNHQQSSADHQGGNQAWEQLERFTNISWTRPEHYPRNRRDHKRNKMCTNVTDSEQRGELRETMGNAGDMHHLNKEEDKMVLIGAVGYKP
jgi:hypothetical protein